MKKILQWFGRKPKQITTPDAMDHVVSRLISDHEYFYAWQANIAVAFQDEFKERFSSPGGISDSAIHQISNDAAKRFLIQLIG